MRTRVTRVWTGVAILLLTAAATTPATASHPTQICLDVEPDDAFRTSNDGVADPLYASVGATDAGHPPEQEGCVIGEGSGGGSTVDFEIEGVSDPDESFTPGSPDLTCTIDQGDNTCRVYPPPSGGGGQRIAAWIDFDKDDSTVELDYDEQQADEDTDATDVASWTWTHADPPPPRECSDGDDDDFDGEIDGRDSGCRHPNDDSEAPERVCWEGYESPGACSSITVTYLKRRDAFRGRVISTMPRCESGRKVRVVRSRDGKLMGRDTSDGRGRWRIDAGPHTKGRFRAIAARKVFTDRYGLEIDCGVQRTPRFRAP